MPGKPKHGKGKTRYSKKSKAITRQAAAPVQATASPGVTGQAVSPAPQPVKPAASKGQTAINEYPYVAGELARIGILAVIILAALVVLSMVLK
jgi:hypothetical protein